MFVIEFIWKQRLYDAEEPNDLDWTPILSVEYATEELANDNCRLCELDDSSYVYRPREVAA